jgi:lactate dehydrogenase-like 2-hydroxyacid dehydrogenase
MPQKTLQHPAKHLEPDRSTGRTAHLGARITQMETGLAGKRVLVRRVGSIGSACARAFAAEGSEVLIHYHQGRERFGRSSFETL